MIINKYTPGLSMAQNDYAGQIQRLDAKILDIERRIRCEEITPQQGKELIDKLINQIQALKQKMNEVAIIQNPEVKKENFKKEISPEQKKMESEKYPSTSIELNEKMNEQLAIYNKIRLNIV